MLHPCALDETLEGCAELATQHATDLVSGSAEILEETLIANAPAILNQLNSALFKIGEWVETTESFAVEQTPILVQEILWWGIASAGFWVVFGIILMLCNPLVRASFGKIKELKEYGNRIGAALNDKGVFGSFALALFGGILLPALGFFTIVCNVMGILKPIIAPRLYLIEYFKDLVG